MSTAVQSVQAERYTVCITSYKEIFLWPTIIEGRGTSSLGGNVRTTFGMLPTSGVNMCACLEKDNYFPITKKIPTDGDQEKSSLLPYTDSYSR